MVVEGIKARLRYLFKVRGSGLGYHKGKISYFSFLRFDINVFPSSVYLFGVIKAIKHESLVDNISSIFVFTGYAIPSYVVAVILLVVFGSELEWFPLGGFVSDEFEDLEFFEQVKDVIYHSILPMTAYVMGSFAVTTVMMKNSLMDNLAADYVRTAMAKGLSFRQAIIKHALRNSLIPLATHFGNNISVILAGSFLIEKIFNIDGFGLLGYESIVERDYPIVMGILVISALYSLLEIFFPTFVLL